MNSRKPYESSTVETFAGGKKRYDTASASMLRGKEASRKLRAKKCRVPGCHAITNNIICIQHRKGMGL